MKIFIAHLFHETNTFAPGVSDVKRFSTGAYCRGEQVRETYAGTRHYIGGMLDRATEDQVETVLSISVGTAGPIIARECLDLFISQILEDLRPCLPEIDGICLALHGAGVAEGITDIEGHFLEILRSVVGSEMPITASLDLHANITCDMLKYCDGIFSLKTYPHIDTHEAGYRAMDCLLRCLKTGKKPVMTACRLPLVAAFTNMCTDRPTPAQEIYRLLEEKSKREGIIDAAFLHGFCYADIPETGMSALVVADQPEKDLCLEIADFAWQRRAQMKAVTVTAEAALDEAISLMEPGKLVIVVEASDCGGAGGPNDGTFVLKHLLEKNPKNAACVSICDSEVADACHTIGVGGTFTGMIGGKADDKHGSQIPVKDAKILGISDGHFRYTTPMYFGQPYCVGNTARLQVGNVEIMVNSVPRQTHDDRMIAITGSDVANYELICLKSGIAYKAFYTKLPQYKTSVVCDPPGSSTGDLSFFHYSNVSRPVYPLDDIETPEFLFLEQA